MKYKIGDKVRIKTQESMKKEFGGGFLSSINTPQYVFVSGMEKQLNENFLNRILTIKEVRKKSYRMEEIDCNWTDGMIECLVKDYKKEVYAPIYSRFEILDL